MPKPESYWQKETVPAHRLLQHAVRGPANEQYGPRLVDFFGQVMRD